jgi:YcaO-like protein with predicted kinase domain
MQDLAQRSSGHRTDGSAPVCALREAIAAEGDGPKLWQQGTHRLISPEETVRRLRTLMAPWGITRLADITGLDRIGIPVVMACRPNARSVSVSQGKGLSLAAATASALVEAAELHHAEHVLRPVLHASPAELAESCATIVLESLPRAGTGRIDPHRPFAWTAAEDLISGTTVWLPHDLIHADLTGRQPPGGGFVVSSNGLAGGNSLTEAAIHALCEVIERDATARWQALDRSVRADTRLEPGSVEDPDCAALLERLDGCGFEVGLWDTTGPTGIASVHAALLDRRDPGGHPGAGDGCHLSPTVALLRALTEAVQTRLTYIAGTRDDLDPEEFRPDVRRDRRQRHETLLKDRPARDFRELVDPSGSTLAGDLETILERLAPGGFRAAYAVDLSRPGTGLSVIRIVIPGMRLPSEGHR